MSKNIPTNKKLYARVKAEAKRKFDRWPSAYGSAWLVKEYKKRGGKYRKAQMGTEVQGPPLYTPGEFNSTVGPYYAAPDFSREELMQRQAYQESRFKPKVESRKGYKGATQIGEAIMSDYEKATGDTRHDPFNPDYAVDVQRWAMNKYLNGTSWIKGSPKVKQAKALAAYNWGPGNALKYLNRAKEKGLDIYSEDLKFIEGMPAETREYINHIMDQDYSDEPDWQQSYETARDTSSVAELYDFAMGGMMYSDTDLDSYKSGGIPQRYKNMGFTKVGAKKKSTRPGKKWMVLAKKGDKYKVVHGGYKGMKDFSQHGSAKRKKRFWDRMGGKNSAKAKDPFSPLYWHKRFGTWAEGGEMEFEPHMMYDPETGKGFMAETYEDHVKMDKMGFTHDAPEMGYGGKKYGKGGINNPGFRALPPEVQDKIRANMKMGGMPCYECGGTMKYGGTPKYQFAGSTPMNPFTQEEEEYMQQTYGTPVDNTELPNLSMNPMEFEEQEEDFDFNFIPGRSDNMRTTKNWMMQTPDGKLPTFTHKSGKKFNLDKAFETVDALSGLAGMAGRNAKRSRQLQQNKQRQFTDNLYDPIRAGEMGSRGDYNISGQFRPDRVANWNPYMAESFNTTPFYQEGGVTEMTDAEIERLRAMGADIEILD